MVGGFRARGGRFAGFVGGLFGFVFRALFFKLSFFLGFVVVLLNLLLPQVIHSGHKFFGEVLPPVSFLLRVVLMVGVKFIIGCGLCGFVLLGFLFFGFLFNLNMSGCC